MPSDRLYSLYIYFVGSLNEMSHKFKRKREVNSINNSDTIRYKDPSLLDFILIPSHILLFFINIKRY